MREIKIYRRVTGVLLFGWMITIFLFSAQPAPDSDRVSGTVAYRVVETYNEVFQKGFEPDKVVWYAKSINYPIRKIAHMSEYAVCGCLMFAVLAGYRKREGRLCLLALLLTALYAMTDEFHQLFVPGRAGLFTDVCIDTTGAAIGLLLLSAILKLHRKHCEKRKLPLQ